ncbi:MAG: ABC-2 family transporter protein [Chloroflexi bacterium]|nr:ABC-2 family transporter protein [Chloroflexota bacterium]
MLPSLKRNWNKYGAVATLAPKYFLAYRGWVWLELFVRALAMTIFYFFWNAVYAHNSTIGGLDLRQTLNYILLAQSIGDIAGSDAIWTIGSLMREGLIGIELLRPVDFQLTRYLFSLMDMLVALIVSIPLLLLGVLAFGLQLPTDPLVWLAYLIALVLGHAAQYMFMWIIACAGFYTTEIWGLSVLVWSIRNFLSGALLPLSMFPAWLLLIASAVPFAQALFVPVSILSGVTPLAAAPRLWLIQIGWLLALFFVSRLVFRVAVRRVTVQGG